MIHNASETEFIVYRIMLPGEHDPEAFEKLYRDLGRKGIHGRAVWFENSDQDPAVVFYTGRSPELDEYLAYAVQRKLARLGLEQTAISEIGLVPLEVANQHMEIHE